MEALSSSSVYTSTALIPRRSGFSCNCNSNTRRQSPRCPVVFPCSPGNSRPANAAAVGYFGLPPSISSCSPRGKRRWQDALPRASSSSSVPSSPGNGGGGEDGEEGEMTAGRGEDDVERALGMDGSIPGSSEEFVRRISSRAYDMRRHLEQTIGSISYDVLETNPWRENPKPVYVLTQRENQLWTMKTRRSRSEVERELELLFSKGGKRRPEIGNKPKYSKTGTKFRMLVEDIREGLLVFEDEHDAVRYCDLLQGGGQGCDGIAELDASSVFDICRKMRALAVLFRRGGTPPLPESLELNLKARKRSLEDQEDLI